MSERESPFRALRHNWYRQWKVGFLSFEIEWVALASQYTFSLSIDRSGGRYDQ